MDRFFYLSSPLPGEIVSCGMEFSQFLKAFDPPVENVLLLKSEYNGKTSVMRNFLTLEDQWTIAQLSQDYGDFHVMDYSKRGAPLNLTNQEVCQLLYLSHMWGPLETPYIEGLNNRFAFLAHDNEWYCKVYLKDWELVPVIGANCLLHILQEAAATPKSRVWKGFWKKTVLPPLGETIGRKLFDGWQDGLCVDVDNMELDMGRLEIPIYRLGCFEDMDTMYQALKQARKGKTPWKILGLDDEGWSL